MAVEVREIIRQRLTSYGRPPDLQLFRQQYSAQWRHLEDLVNRVTTCGESNSALVIGPSGCGKTTLVESVVEQLRKDGCLAELMVVRLSGLLQTDDRLALKEITRQFRLEAAIGGRVFNSFAENLAFLLESLKQGDRESCKPVLFLVDKFDLFCHHRNQTLLYNLFDVAQSAQAPICVIGLTCRLDVVELLEKRVKSRFSHRQLHLSPIADFSAYRAISQAYLSLPSEQTTTDAGRRWNHEVTLLMEDKRVTAVLEQLFCFTRDINALKQLLYVAVSLGCSSGGWKLSSLAFQEAWNLRRVDCWAVILEGLSVLELCLVIAMMHLFLIYEGEPFNFEMVMKEFGKFSQKSVSMQNFGRPVVLKAFENLQSLELVRPVEGGCQKIMKEHQLTRLAVTSQQIQAAVSAFTGLPTDVRRWADSNLL